MESRKAEAFLQEIVSKVNAYTQFMTGYAQIERFVKMNDDHLGSHYRLFYSGISGRALIEQNLNVPLIDKNDSPGLHYVMFLEKDLLWLTDQNKVDNLKFLDEAIKSKQKKWEHVSRLIMNLVNKWAKIFNVHSISICMSSVDPSPRLTLSTDNDAAIGKVRILFSEVKTMNLLELDSASHFKKNSFDFVIDDDNYQSVDALLTQLHAAVLAKPPVMGFFAIESKDTAEHNNNPSKKPERSSCIVC